MAKALPEQWSASVLRLGFRIERDESCGGGAGPGPELVVAAVPALGVGVDMTDQPRCSGRRHHDCNIDDDSDRDSVFRHGQPRGTTPGGGGGHRHGHRHGEL